jgi:hypothetical protein
MRIGQKEAILARGLGLDEQEAVALHLACEWASWDAVEMMKGMAIDIVKDCFSDIRNIVLDPQHYKPEAVDLATKIYPSLQLIANKKGWSL